MNIVDIIILIPILYFTIKGVIKGIISQVTQFAGLVFGIILSFLFYETVGQYISKYADYDHINALSFVLIFVCVFVLSIVIGKSITSLTKSFSLGPINRALGGVFGFIKAFAIIYILLSGLTIISENFSTPIPKEIYESQFYRIVIEINASFDLLGISIDNSLYTRQVFTLQKL